MGFVVGECMGLADWRAVWMNVWAWLLVNVWAWPITGLVWMNAWRDHWSTVRVNAWERPLEGCVGECMSLVASGGRTPVVMGLPFG